MPSKSTSIPIAHKCSGLCSVHCNWEHEEIRKTMKWPLRTVGDDNGREILCARCDVELWGEGSEFDLQVLYEATFSHRLDGCNGRTE